MKHLLTSLLFVALIVFSCKKKDDPVPADNQATTGATTSTSGTTTGGTTTGTTTTGGSTTGGSTTGGSTTGGSTTGGSTTGGSPGGTFTPTSPSPVNGILTIRSTTVATSAIPSVHSESEVYFSQTPFAEFTPSLGIYGGRVTLNSDSLLFRAGTSNSYSRSPVKTLSQGNWSVKGGNSIPAITFNASFPFPVCHNTQVLPLKLSRSKGAVVTLDLENVTEGWFWITFSNSNVTIETGFGFTGTNPTFTITPQQMEWFTGMQSGICSLRLENASMQNVQGQYFRFMKESVLNKNIEIVP